MINFSFKLRACLLILVFIIGTSCQESKEQSKQVQQPNFKRDLPDIKEDGKLRAVTVYSGTSYFLYKGKAMGYEFELLERLAKHLKLELEMVIARDIDDLIKILNRGEADLLAYGLAITETRKDSVAFTDYLYLTKQVLVQKKPDDWRSLHWLSLENSLKHDAIELIGDTVSIRSGSSYKDRILNLSSELGDSIYIEELPGHMATETIIKKVAEGDIKYTIADRNIAQIMASYYPVLKVDVPISFSQRIGWATRKNSPKLLEASNSWLEQMKKSVDYNVIYNKYFKNKKSFKRRVKSDFYSLNKEEISPYDALIKKHSKKIGWDWRLMASLIYQESRFDPNNSSWADAQGLMQIMPRTAEDLGVTDRTDPEQSIIGGTRYLNEMWDNFEAVTDSVQRRKFAMAAYNCGLYHVIDAQNLAEDQGVDPKLWDGNVEDMILALSNPENYNHPVVKYGYVRGTEPYNYVRQIYERYEHYKQFISE